MKRDRQSVNLRHAEMLALIRQRQEVLVEELSEAFDVSPMTVRRDLQVLEEQGKISRFHGGATVDVRALSAEGRDEIALCRRMIARQAAALVSDGDSLLINGSNTAVALLDYVKDKSVQAFTNNGMIVGRRYAPGVEVQLSGGVLRGAQHILTGDIAMRNLINVRAKKAFLGCAGISPDGEILCGIPAELAINEMMIDHSDEYYIVADYTKIGKTSPYASFHLEKPGWVITDDRAPAQVLDQLRAIGMKVVQAGRADETGSTGR